MVNLKIDGIAVTVPEGTTILDAARQAGINIPTLCYLKGLNEIGACRVCVVEKVGESHLIAACDNAVEEGIEILTNSPKVRASRRANVELILSQHSSRCPSCVRSGNCSLQKVANDLGITSESYDVRYSPFSWNEDFPLIRDASKCIRCMRCIQVCEKIQGLGIWDLNGTGTRTDIGVSGGKKIEDTACVLCGQCITHCPVGALHERDDTQKALAALADSEITTVIQIAPAVRAAWGEDLGMSRDEASVKRLVAALRKVGFDYIFDTDFSADLTIMEEGSEFLERLKSGDIAKYPMFTSCCPGWVRFIKSQYPDMVDRLSSAKSPQAMFGAVTKTYFADKIGKEPEKIFCISVMPCVSKKQEIDIPNINDSAAKDVDLVLTTREVDRIFRAEHIDVASLAEEEFDSPLGESTGAAVIFGTTGGVMEAALRSAYFLVTGTNPDPDHFKAVRGFDGPWREAEFELAGSTLRVAVASGLANTRELIEAIRAGKVHYDFVEIMACPGGCGGGGGQPICDGSELAQVRDEKLYALDRESKLRFSHENPSVQALYSEFLGSPLSEKSHHLLHTDHHGWHMPCEGK